MKKYKNKDILFVLCPFLDVSLPYLGVSYLCEYLESRGCSPGVLDINIELFHKYKDFSSYWYDRQNMWIDREKFFKLKNKFKNEIEYYVKLILNTRIKKIGFSVFDSNSLFILEIVKGIRARDNDIKIIFGGPFCFNRNSSMSVIAFADFLVVGEGEDSCFEIVKMIDSNKNYVIPGVINCSLPEEPKLREPINDLSVIPFPTYKNFNLEKYQINSKLPIILSRGCNHGACTFCDVMFRWGKVRFRRAIDVFNEIKYHMDRNKAFRFYFNDSCINGNIPLLNDFLDLVIETNLKIEIDALMRVRKDMDIDLCKKMKNAGFWRLEYGIETGSDKVLRKMRKGYTVKEAERVMRITHEAGIMVAINIIVGFPGETEDDFKETLDFLIRNKSSIDCVEGLTPCHVLPFSDLDLNKTEYNIISPEYFYGEKWYTSDGNTSDIRLKRRQTVEELLPKLDIKH